MILIEKGAIYRACRAKAGSGEKGDWELVAVEDPNNAKRTQTIFVEPPTGIREGQSFKVLEITRFKNGWKKDHQGQWKPEANITASIEPIAYEGDTEDGEPNPWDLPGWDDLPM